VSKSKTIFTCQECGYESQGWLGKCPACSQWNTFIEEIIPTAAKGRKTALDRDRVGETRAISIKDIEKRANLHLHNYDAYVNVVGGLKVVEPACDLGIAVAIASSFKNVNVDSDTILIGEIGLTGEVRAVNKIEIRVNEAMRIGFKSCIVPYGNMKMVAKQNDQLYNKIKLMGVRNIQEVLDLML
jgi:DNA repair protein RadA/Sms